LKSDWNFAYPPFLNLMVERAMEPKSWKVAPMSHHINLPVPFAVIWHKKFSSITQDGKL